MYKRIVLKLSGETLAPAEIPANKSASLTFDAERVDRAAEAIVKLHDLGVQVGIVMGGGNIWRGRFTDEMNAVQADQMGMLATVINALAVQDAIIRMGRKATVYTPQEMTRFAEHYRADRAIEKMNEGHIVLLAGGSGNPFFTTDTAAVLRAAELKADAVFKGTTVDGVYSADPRTDPSAVRFDSLSYEEVLARRLAVMDSTATCMAMDNRIPVMVFALKDPENILRVLHGEAVGTIVR